MYFSLTVRELLIFIKLSLFLCFGFFWTKHTTWIAWNCVTEIKIYWKFFIGENWYTYTLMMTIWDWKKRSQLKYNLNTFDNIFESKTCKHQSTLLFFQTGLWPSMAELHFVLFANLIYIKYLSIFKILIFIFKLLCIISWIRNQ